MDKAPPQIFSPRRACAKWARAKSRHIARHITGRGEAPFLLSAIVEDVIERLQFMRPDPGKALVIGDWTDALASHLADCGWDVSAKGLEQFTVDTPFGNADYDLVIHLIGLGHVNDLPGALLHCRAALSDGGLFLSSFPGAGSLTLLRQIAIAADGDRPVPRCHPLVDSAGGAALLQRAGFKRQVVDSHTISARYSALSKLVEDLRDHGLTSALRSASPPFTRNGLERMQSSFAQLTDDQGKATESFEIINLTAWK